MCKNGRSAIVFSHLHLPSIVMGLFTSIAAAVALAASVVSASLYGESTDNHTCVLSPDYASCSPQATPGNVDTCCVETFGGLLLQTQFWNTYTGLEEEGQLLPEGSWGVHGLWPDFW